MRRLPLLFLLRTNHSDSTAKTCSRKEKTEKKERKRNVEQPYWDGEVL